MHEIHLKITYYIYFGNNRLKPVKHPLAYASLSEHDLTWILV